MSHQTATRSFGPGLHCQLPSNKCPQLQIGWNFRRQSTAAADRNCGIRNGRKEGSIPKDGFLEASASCTLLGVQKETRQMFFLSNNNNNETQLFRTGVQKGFVNLKRASQFADTHMSHGHDVLNTISGAVAEAYFSIGMLKSYIGHF